MAEHRQELTDPQAYIRKMKVQCGGRDPMAVLAETPVILAKLAASQPADVLRRRPFEGKWTPTEVLGHLLDAEFVFGYRIRTIFADERPQIIGMDQDKWVTEEKYNSRDAADIASDFAAVRAVNLKMYRLIAPAHYARVGIHNERGEESLGDVIHYAAGHDLWHVDQYTRYAAAADKM